MKRIIYLFVGLAVSAGAEAHGPLDSVFNTLKCRPQAEVVEVSYSGTFSPEMKNFPGFLFQRGEGRGWTKGVRLAIADTDADEAKRIQAAFDAAGKDLGAIVRHGMTRTCLDEKTNTAYSFDYNPDTKRLYLLRADVEDQVCIPADWPTRDYFYSPVQKTNWAAALARLYTEVKYNSAFFHRFAADWDSVYYSSLRQLDGADDFESYRILQKAVAACGDGHTFIYGFGGSSETPRTSPFRTVLLGDRVFVDAVECDELEKAGMKRGMEILAVNGETPRDYARHALRPYVSTSTPQWADHEMFDNYGLSTGRAGAPLNLTLSADGGKSRIEIPHTIAGCSWNMDKVASRDYAFRKTAGNVGVLTIPSFQSADVRTFFDSIYPALLDSDALVIDLRGNGGGNSSHADYILRHLTRDSIPNEIWSTPLYNPAFASWGRPREWYTSEADKMPPIEGKRAYTGPVAVLTDRGTFSAAEDFCALFRSMKRGPIVGTPTGGSTGNGVRVMLARGIHANICAKYDRMADGTDFVGVGIIPDSIIEQTPESYFSADKDIVLDKALTLLAPAAAGRQRQNSR